MVNLEKQVLMSKGAFYIYCIFLLTLPVKSLAQYSFQKIFGGKADDIGSKVLELKNGNFLFAGENDNNYVSCFNKKGDLLWQKSFGYHNSNLVVQETKGLVEASDGYIYLGGDAEIWNWGNPIIYKMDTNGNILYDTAYYWNYKGNSFQNIDFLLDEPESQCLVSVGDANNNISYYPVFQKTRYNGERLYFKFLTDLEGYYTYSMYKTVNSLGYSLVCEHSNTGNVFLVKLDTAGNVLLNKILFNSQNKSMSFSHNKQGTIFCISQIGSTALKTKDIIYSFTSNGDSLKSINVFGKGYSGKILCNNNESLIVFTDPYLYWADSTLNITDSVYQINQIDSLTLGDVKVANDGGILFASSYYGTYNCVRTFNNAHDFYFSKTDPNGLLNPDVGFMRTGISAEPTNTSPITVYPNPVCEELHIQSKYTSLVTELYSMQGLKVVTQSGQLISTSTLASAMYLLIVKNNNGEIVHQQKISVIHE